MATGSVTGDGFGELEFNKLEEQEQKKVEYNMRNFSEIRLRNALSAIAGAVMIIYLLVHGSGAHHSGNSFLLGAVTFATACFSMNALFASINRDRLKKKFKMEQETLKMQYNLGDLRDDFIRDMDMALENFNQQIRKLGSTARTYIAI